MYLTNTTETLQVILAGAVTTNQSVVTVDYGENTATTFVAGKQRSVTNGTTAVNILSAPAASTQRIVQFLTMTNADTAPITVTFRTNDGGTLGVQFGPVTLLPGDRVEFATDTGFRVFNSGGEPRAQGLAPILYSGLKNRLLNASFFVNQDQFAGGALAAGVYGHDCWKAGTGGCNYSVNATTGVVTHTSGPLVQIIETPRLAGVQVTVSVDTPSGSVGVNVDGQTGTITAGSGRRGVTVTVPIGSTGDVTVTLTATGVTYKEPQLEVGPSVTAFDFISRDIAEIRCKRYYHTTYSNLAVGSSSLLGAAAAAAASATQMLSGQQFPVPMRIAPAMTIWSTAGTINSVMPISGGADIGSMVVEQIGIMGFLRINATATGLVSGELYRYHYRANARL